VKAKEPATIDPSIAIKAMLESGMRDFTAIAKSLNVQVKLVKTVAAELGIAAKSRQADNHGMAALLPQGSVDQTATINDLVERNARLEQMLIWATRSSVSERTGGTLTLFRSDDHFGDRAHLPRCIKSMTQKWVTLVGQYQPDRVQILSGGDWVSGIGIYKEQNKDNVLQEVSEQVQLGVVKMSELLEGTLDAMGPRPKNLKGPRITIRMVRGNHDYAHGHEITSYLHMLMKAVLGSEDVEIVNEGVRAVVNLADKGTYNVLLKHGTGHSPISPTSSGFWNQLKDEIIQLSWDLEAGSKIRAVLHGHVHWYSVMERIIGFKVYCAGGCQRNERVKLNQNQRPLGWWVFPSPRGHDSIMQPLEVQPSEAIANDELGSARLALDNMLDAHESLQKFRPLAEALGDLSYGSLQGKLCKEGRW
jgi:hypothetical protein